MCNVATHIRPLSINKRWQYKQIFRINYL